MLMDKNDSARLQCGVESRMIDGVLLYRGVAWIEGQLKWRGPWVESKYSAQCAAERIANDLWRSNKHLLTQQRT